jgi:hypothetical protein
MAVKSTKKLKNYNFIPPVGSELIQPVYVVCDFSVTETQYVAKIAALCFHQLMCLRQPMGPEATTSLVLTLAMVRLNWHTAIRTGLPIRHNIPITLRTLFCVSVSQATKMPLIRFSIMFRTALIRL